MVGTFERAGILILLFGKLGICSCLGVVNSITFGRCLNETGPLIIWMTSKHAFVMQVIIL